MYVVLYMTHMTPVKRGRRTAGGRPPRVDVVIGQTIAVMEAYERHRRELFGFLLRSTRDSQLSEDLLQETFLRLVTHVRRGSLPADVRAWLFRVAANQVVSAARRRQTAARWAPILVRREEGAPTIEAAYLQRESNDRVEAALRLLSADARTAMLMAAHGLSTAETARAIGRTELAVRSLLCRSRLRVREHLEQQEEQ